MIHTAELIWQNIIGTGANRIDNFVELLNLQPGASEQELRRLEETLGVTLPEEFKSFYSVYNGQIWNSGVEPVIINLYFSLIAEIIDNWTFLQKEFDPDNDLEPEIGEELKQVLWHSKWIPIAENGAGDYLCIDTDPSEKGKIGQILYYYHDWGNRSIEANNLFDFIEICLNEE